MPPTFRRRSPSRPRPTARRRSIRPFVAALETRQLLTTLSGGVQINVSPVSSLSSYAGVGFRLNPVADISGVVNNSRDANPGDFTAQVRWGDGSSSTGSLAADGGDVLVKASHTYKQQGQYAVTVVVDGPDGSTASAQTCSVDVVPMPEAASQPIAAPATSGGAQPLGSVALNISPESSLAAYAGVGFRLNPIAAIGCSYNNGPDVLPSDFHAQVNWGDGPAWDAGTTLASVGSSVLVKGTHVYKQQGVYDVVVYVTGPDGQTASNQTTVVDVSPMPEAASQPIALPATYGGAQAPGDVGLNLSPESTLAAYAGVGFALNPVASIEASYNNGSDVRVGDFHAQVNWGDGPTWDANTGLAALGGAVLVKGTHVYQQQGIYHVVVYVTGPDGQTASNQTTVVDVSPMPDPGSQPIAVPANPGGPRALGAVGLNLSPVSALGATAGVAIAPTPIADIGGTYNFSPDVNVGDYHAQVNWGDTPTWDAGPTLAAEDGFVEVRGSHTYQQPGHYHVVAYVTGPDGQTASAQTTFVDVAPAPPTLTVYPVTGDAFNAMIDQGIGFPVAYVTYTGPDPSASGFQGEIVDGDGSDSTPTFVPEGGATFAIYDPYRYREPGRFPVTVLASYEGTSGQTSETADVAAPSKPPAKPTLKGSISSAAIDPFSGGPTLTGTLTIQDPQADRLAALALEVIQGGKVVARGTLTPAGQALLGRALNGKGIALKSATPLFTLAADQANLVDGEQGKTVDFQLTARTAAGATSTFKSAPSSALVGKTGQFLVPAGQVTFDAEGNETPYLFSRKLQLPPGSSGVTIGRGYDISRHTASQAKADLTAAGLPAKVVAVLIKAAAPDPRKGVKPSFGITGSKAAAFLKAHADVVITPAQQKALFERIYPGYESAAISKANAGIAELGKQTVDWKRLNPAIVQIVTDLNFRGDLGLSGVIKALRPSLLANDLAAFEKVLADPKVFRDASKNATGRFNARVQFLKQAIAAESVA